MSYAPGAPALTAEEVDEVSKSVSASLFEDPQQAGIIASVMARRMKAASTREAQDRAGASVLHLFASMAERS